MKKSFSLLLTMVLALSLSACSSTPAAPATPAERMTDVTVLLDYLVNTNHTGLYVAQELGFYLEAGLNVNIIEPTDGVTASLIAAGRGEFGVSYQEDLTFARASADPLPVKAIAAIIQHNTSGFASHQDKNITTVRDFEGKIYAGWGSPAEEAILKAVMTDAGADYDMLTFITSDASGHFGLQDRFDIIWTFQAWDNIAAELDGVPLNYIELRSIDDRLDYYTPIIITRDALIEQNPELVRDFLSATKRGYEYAIAHPNEAAKILHQFAPAYSLEMITMSQLFLSEKYAEDAPSWGLMKAEVWDNYTSFMVESGLIERTVPSAECFTNEFLD